ncbi:MAG: UvrD-helicase domain-containing protein, partial [Oscillospiraceae bacterium]|nr:UvrD-helicase domain-containing protein [Oscillospiraceae bacterium]
MDEIKRQTCLSLRRRILERAFFRMNEMQRAAVFCVRGPLLVLAGAGSGKTTVLVNRIANIVRYGEAYHSEQFSREPSGADIALMESAAQGDAQALEKIAPLLRENPCPARQVLSITFTNKAANEMKERLAAILGETARDLWAGTFHSVCVKILRRHDGGFPEFNAHFAIYDADDSRRMMKEVQRQLEVDEKYLPCKQILNAISRAKDQLLTPDDFARESVHSDGRQRLIAEAYARYQKLLAAANAMDFDDIIFNTVKLLEQNAEVRAHYQQMFRYILVDEYQDTSHAQDQLICILAAKHRNLCVVGDDDQSIYSFRGAVVDHILRFDTLFPEARVVRLEQNYRSTQAILNAANAVIKNNAYRKGKELWTANNPGEALIFQKLQDEREEAQWVVDTILSNVSGGRMFGEHAVLYRANALSNSVEQAFVRAGVPYRIIGGRRFYERKEIRDALGYLRVIANPADDLRLRRVINEPKRGIGETTVGHASSIAEEEGVSLYQVFLRADQYPALHRAAGRIAVFMRMIEN